MPQGPFLDRPCPQRDLPVRSVHGRTCLSRPYSEGPAFGGTRLSGPSFDIGSSIALRRGLKSRAESGAKAPHSIWSAAIHRRFSVKALAFTTLALIRMESDYRSRWNPTLQATQWRDLLVRSALGGTCLSGPYSEGRACHVRLSNLDDPPQFARASVGTIHEWPRRHVAPPASQSFTKVGMGHASNSANSIARAGSPTNLLGLM